jgi:hypothetical protein
MPPKSAADVASVILTPDFVSAELPFSFAGGEQAANDVATSAATAVAARIRVLFMY